MMNPEIAVRQDSGWIKLYDLLQIEIHRKESANNVSEDAIENSNAEIEKSRDIQNNHQQNIGVESDLEQDTMSQNNIKQMLSNISNEKRQKLVQTLNTATQEIKKAQKHINELIDISKSFSKDD